MGNPTRSRNPTHSEPWPRPPSSHYAAHLGWSADWVFLNASGEFLDGTPSTLPKPLSISHTSPESSHEVFERRWLHLQCPQRENICLGHWDVGHSWSSLAVVALSTGASSVGSGYAITITSVPRPGGLQRQGDAGFHLQLSVSAPYVKFKCL